MGDNLLDFDEIDQTQVAMVGGKGAQLGELCRIEGVSVPAGFCITTDSFKRMMAAEPSMPQLLDKLSDLSLDDPDAIRSLSADIRQTIEQASIPEDLTSAITRSIARLGEHAEYAVRSSATRGGFAFSFFRWPAGLVPQRGGIPGRPTARPPVLGLTFHRAGRDLPNAKRV